MQLYVEHGYDATTVAEIAARAGLTERTFFRHFADKREVLFSGSAQLAEVLVQESRTRSERHTADRCGRRGVGGRRRTHPGAR